MLNLSASEYADLKKWGILVRHHQMREALPHKTVDEWHDGRGGHYKFKLYRDVPFEPDTDEEMDEEQPLPISLSFELHWKRRNMPYYRLFPFILTHFDWDYSEPDQSPLHLLARYARTDMIHRILQEGASVRARAKNKTLSIDVTALHLVVISNVFWSRRETVRTLLDHGADPEARGKGKRGHLGSCLDFAAQEGPDHLRELRMEIDASKGSPSSLSALCQDAVRNSIWASWRQKEKRKYPIQRSRYPSLFKARRDYKKAIESLDVPIDIKIELRI